ncbi:MAG TPA: NADH-quinone oxidoreductase subunit NuoG [Caulobacteraceae bacterium]|jgi:NADH-quinone oxidoreductase subunit G
MPKAKVNGVEVEFEAGMTALQVAELAGEEIPRFCYHERLSIAGNCRMCLVEVKPGPPKPQASCALPAAENMEITTNSPMVKKAREGVMEFLLINHPLDCPICDQGGECDLQDQALGYGRDMSRYQLNKRAVEEKYMGPTVKTVMTRCIQCTRCVRFVTEIAGVSDIGMIARGEDAEITTYLEKAIDSELSGNVNDLCPVGALTHRPWAFNYRPWELHKVEGVDVMDALGSNIVIQRRANEVMRILPRNNDDVNEEWLSDKSRYVVDGLMRQRLDRPYVRVDGKLREATWGQAFDVIAERMRASSPERVGVIAGDLQDAESMKAALDLFGGAGVPNLDCRQDGAQIGGGPREGYLLNSTIAGLERADAILLVGTNPRLEAPLLNARIRKGWLNRGVAVGLIGQPADLTYPFAHLGDGGGSVGDTTGWDRGFLDRFQGAQAPAIVVGQGALARPDGGAVLRAAGSAGRRFNVLRDGWNGFNVLHTAASRVGGLDLGFLPRAGGMAAPAMVGPGALDVLFLLGADEIELSATDAFVVYMGTHGDRGAHRADVILPSAAYTEKSGIYVNMEGRVQMAARAVFPKGEAREDWAILRALSERLGAKLPYDSLEELRARLFAEHPTFGRVDYMPSSGGGLDLDRLGVDGDISGEPFRSPIEDYYLTNPIARASVTMAECSAARGGRATLMAAE